MAEVRAGREDIDLRPEVVGVPTADCTSVDGLRMRSPQSKIAKEEGVGEEEGEEYDGVQQQPPTEEEKRWGRRLSCASLMDVVFSGAFVVSCFSYAYVDAGVSLWCMGIQAISHLLSSLLLAFRFCAEHALPSTDEASAAGLLRKRRRRFLHREQAVSVIMGSVMVVSSCALLFKAFRKIKFWDKWYQDQQLREAMDTEVQWVTEFLAWYGVSMYFLQAVLRLAAARKIRRSIVWHSFIASTVSVLFLLVLGLGASYQKEWSWKAEPIAAIGLTFLAIAEGIRIILMYLDDVDNRLRVDPRA